MYLNDFNDLYGNSESNLKALRIKGGLFGGQRFVFSPPLERSESLWSPLSAATAGPHPGSLSLFPANKDWKCGGTSLLIHQVFKFLRTQSFTGMINGI